MAHIWLITNVFYNEMKWYPLLQVYNIDTSQSERYDYLSALGIDSLR